MSNSSNPAQWLTLLVEGRYVGLHRFFVPVQRGLNFQDPLKEYHEAEVRMNLRMSIVILADREWGCREATSEEAVNNYDLVFCLAVWPTRETKENMGKWKPWPGLPSCPPSWPGTPRYHALADKTYQNKEKCSTFQVVTRKKHYLLKNQNRVLNEIVFLSPSYPWLLELLDAIVSVGLHMSPSDEHVESSSVLFACM